MKLQETTIQHWIELAKSIATEVHKDQKRRGGEPYINHLRRVANGVSDRLKPIAWLHDSVEDHPDKISLADLRNHGFPSYVIRGVDLMTHKEGKTNLQYWQEMLVSDDAVQVKLVDIQDNLSSQPSDHAKQKYARAIEFFKNHGYLIIEKEKRDMLKNVELQWA